ncbi:hypothetical protein EVAR_23818_1 [Eumeta japonica]|uniref:Uncharacterized protein n=1 Tax=Eumeta variegata TaxID=151549 RepID=A0A4C1VM92_EUMVA|nr:hypothetical protein EVAR_23818_1 [Eumeta japonica]
MPVLLSILMPEVLTTQCRNKTVLTGKTRSLLRAGEINEKSWKGFKNISTIFGSGPTGTAPIAYSAKASRGGDAPPDEGSDNGSVWPASRGRRDPTISYKAEAFIVNTFRKRDTEMQFSTQTSSRDCQRKQTRNYR